MRLSFSALVAVISLLLAFGIAGAAPKAPVHQEMAPVQSSSSPPLDLADYMFGPPPHNHIDPGMRCWMRCPKKSPAPTALR